MQQPGTERGPEGNSDSPYRRIQVHPETNDSEVAYMVMAYANAAGDAARLGFDSAEILGAHGYLIDGFFGGYGHPFRQVIWGLSRALKINPRGN